MPDRLAVRLPNWLGDTVMAVPALRAVRDTFPDARILAAGPWARVLAGQGLADVLVTYPRRWSGRLRVADTIRDFRASLAVLLTNSFESALAARYWRAGRRVGFAAEGRDWLLTDAVRIPEPRLHQTDEYLLIAERVGAVPTARDPALVAPADGADVRAEARQLLRAAGVVPADRPVVGVHLGAAYGSSKVLPPESVVHLVHALRRGGGEPVLLGPLDSIEPARAITGSVAVASLVGRDTPDLLPALLTEVDVVIGGDTGVSHLAAALGTPVVAVFGPTDPRLTAPRGATAIVREPVPCAPCFYRECPIDHPCLRRIVPEEVAARAFALIGRPVRG